MNFIKILQQSFLIFSTCCIITAVSAQNEGNVDTSLVATPSWKNRPHDVNFSAGGFNYFYNWLYGIYGFSSCNKAGCNINDLMENRSNLTRFVSPSVKIEYSYKFAIWFAFGGVMSYATGMFKTYSNYDMSVVGTSFTHYIAIAPKVRFDWLNRKHVTMYSSLSLGVGISIDCVSLTNEIRTNVTYFADATFVGIKAGKNWYGLAEFGYGISGLFKLGFGYRF